MDRKEHWNRVYAQKASDEVSWYQAEPRVSLELIQSVTPRGGRVIDVGGGVSFLPERLLDLGLGLSEVAVLDIASQALECAARRLGERAGHVRWIEADVTTSADLGSFDVWHDRAVFHFLNDPSDRRKYVAQAKRSVVPGGHLIVATFALDGPERCSNLEVSRYDANGLASEFNEGFSLMKSLEEAHQTPWGSTQRFLYGLFRRNAEPEESHH